MNKRRLTVVDDVALEGLVNLPVSEAKRPCFSWVRMIRTYLRMTQAELSNRAKLPQSHIAAIETGKMDPRASTLQKIFDALSCQMEPRPIKPLPEILRGRARSIALKRLKQSAGTMALENQAPDEKMFSRLLEKQTDRILGDRREKLWNKRDEE